MEHHFYLKEWLTNSGYLDLETARHFIKKWTKWTFHFKENHFLLVGNDKIQGFK